MEVVDDDLGLQREQPRQVREAVRERPVRGQVLEVAVVRRHVGARRRGASVNVCFSSAPTASSGTGVATGSGIGSGAYPRARRTTDSRPATTRVTESS